MSEHLAHSDQPAEDESGIIWSALQRGGIWITRGKQGEPFSFASGLTAEVKGDASRLRSVPDVYQIVLDRLVVHPCVAWADVLAPVPNGTIPETAWLARQLGKQVIGMHRPDDATSHHDMQYNSRADRELAAAVGSVCFIEDVTSTGSTPYAQAEVLREVNPHIAVHTLSILHRSPVLPQYQQGAEAVVYHALCATAEPVPRGYDEFVERYGVEPVLVGPDEE